MIKPKADNVTILSITTNDYTVYGLGDDQKVYYWDTDKV